MINSFCSYYYNWVPENSKINNIANYYNILELSTQYRSIFATIEEESISGQKLLPLDTPKK